MSEDKYGRGEYGQIKKIGGKYMTTDDILDDLNATSRTMSDKELLEECRKELQSCLSCLCDGKFDCTNIFNLIINGFCKEVFRELPMEFAVEAQKLLGVSLEGSVG